MRKCPFFPHLKHALHSFEAWLSRLQCLQGPLELFLLSFGRLGFVFWGFDPRQLLSQLLVFRHPFEFFWNRTVRVPWESVLFDRKGWLRFGVLLRCRDPSWLGLGLAFLNHSVSVRTSSSIHSLAGGSGVSREIAFTLVSAIWLVDGTLFSISREEFNSMTRARASSAVAGLDFLSSHRSVASLRPSLKLVSTICSTKWGMRNRRVARLCECHPKRQQYLDWVAAVQLSFWLSVYHFVVSFCSMFIQYVSFSMFHSACSFCSSAERHQLISWSQFVGLPKGLCKIAGHFLAVEEVNNVACCYGTGKTNQKVGQQC